jgi:hypothetical protein
LPLHLVEVFLDDSPPPIGVWELPFHLTDVLKLHLIEVWELSLRLIHVWEWYLPVTSVWELPL